jgi:predicted nucleotidyltransferase component of viral defense system
MTNDDQTASLIEEFHLTFLHVLTTALKPSLYVLKGGANLRYFFGSFRYSQDIDLDYLGNQTWRLEEVVDGVLASPALGMSLRASGISLVDPTKPKQTETTRRWKMGLTSAHLSGSAAARTEIEFSTRSGSSKYEFATLPDSVIERYGLRSFSVQRYGLPAMIEQKIAALANRSQTKARDVFDLDLLFRLRAKSRNEEVVGSAYAQEASSRALGLSDENFESEVAPFLEPEIARLYEAPDTWERMRIFVYESVEALTVVSDKAVASDLNLEGPQSPGFHERRGFKL